MIFTFVVLVILTFVNMWSSFVILEDHSIIKLTLFIIVLSTLISWRFLIFLLIDYNVLYSFEHLQEQQMKVTKNNKCYDRMSFVGFMKNYHVASCFQKLFEVFLLILSLKHIAKWTIGVHWTKFTYKSKNQIFVFKCCDQIMWS